MFREELGPELERDDVICDSSLLRDVSSCSCVGELEFLPMGGIVWEGKHATFITSLELKNKEKMDSIRLSLMNLVAPWEPYTATPPGWDVRSIAGRP